MDFKSILRKLSGRDTRAIRIPVTPGDKKERYVTVPLRNSFEFLDILSLRLAETDAYRLFDANYGVVVGRVIGNEGIGIPNAKITLFIPREEIEAVDNPTIKDYEQQLMNSLYPYDSVSDEDGRGRRYNILPSSSRNRGFNGFPENELGIGATPKVPVGSFVEKEEVLTNGSVLSVYEKYYKYSTTTNDSGDYMIFGVPTGNYTVHMDCDLTDIGRWSMSPLLMTKTLGYPKELFEEDGTKVLASTDLSVLPNIQTQNMTVQVKPLWSQNSDNQDVIGITRQDFKISAHLKPFFTVFGSNFTMAKSKWWGDRVIFRLHWGWKNLCFGFGPDREPSSCSFRMAFKFKIRFGIDIYLFSIGDPDGRGLTFQPRITLDIQFPNVMPFVSFEIGDNYCRLTGGKYDNTAFDIINHGNTCQCSIKDALKEIPDDGVSDGLMLSSHRVEPLNIKLFTLDEKGVSQGLAVSLKNDIDYFANNRLPIIPLNPTDSQIQDARPRTFVPYSTTTLNQIDTDGDIKLLRDGEYVKLVEPGQFILQVPTNRRLMVTAEDGRLVESLDPNKGVFTEFRGYMYVNSDSDIDNPPTTARTGRIALKIPQQFDYSYNPKIWMLDHGLFEAGEIYSVAQKYPTAHTEFSAADEEENDLDGPFNGTSGWDNQTGLLMDVDYGSKGSRVAGLAEMAMVPNHTTNVGTEYDYTLPGHSGDYSQDGQGSGQTQIINSSQPFGGETNTIDFTGTPYATTYTESGFKIRAIAFEDFDSLAQSRINTALQNQNQSALQDACEGGYYRGLNNNSNFGKTRTVNGRKCVFRIEYQGTPSSTLRFTLTGLWTDSNPNKVYALDSQMRITPFDFHPAIIGNNTINVTNVYHFVWNGGMHYDIPVPPNPRVYNVNWKVVNEANSNEYGVTGVMRHEIP